jgi:hypothetical protein
LEEDFNNFSKYEEVLNKLRSESVVNEFMSNLTPKDSISDMFKKIESEFDEYTEASRAEIKYGVIIWKTLEDVKRITADMKIGMDDLKRKLYNETYNKNKNLLNFNYEEELATDEFKSYIKYKVNKDGKLNALLDEKKRNEQTINENKIKIKCEESLLLESFYCLKCKMKPRNILSLNCYHLVSCEDCINNTKICPKCGNDIDKYDKIFR